MWVGSFNYILVLEKEECLFYGELSLFKWGLDGVDRVNSTVLGDNRLIYVSRGLTRGK